MENLFRPFVPSHYPCIGNYEVDLSENCIIGCVYCSLKNKIPLGERFTQIPKVPLDLREKGIYLSPNSDPFSPHTRDLAHDFLKYYLPQGVPFLIITKSYIPDETVALLAQYSSQVYVQISLSRLDDDMNELLEYGSAKAEYRLKTIDALSSAGIRVVPVMMPMFPGIDDTKKSLSATISACASVGAKYLKAAYVVLNIHNPNIVKKMVSTPELKKSFEEMREYIDIHVGGGLTVGKERRMKTYELITQLCSDHGMQFQACPILDPAVVEANNVCLCASYRKKVTT